LTRRCNLSENHSHICKLISAAWQIRDDEYVD